MTGNKYRLGKELEYYSKSLCDRSALDYSHLSRYIVGTVGLDFFVGKKVLDIGCGEGIYSAWIADTGKAEHVVGLELTRHRMRSDYLGIFSNLHFVCGDIFNLPVRKEKFDVIFMNLVLHHMRFNLRNVGEAIRNCLRNDGVVLAFEPNVYSPLSFLAHLVHHKSENEGFLSPVRVRKEFRRCGFRDVDIGYFWRDFRWARNPLLASCFWVRAKR